MTTLRSLGAIAAGYGLAALGGVAAVALNEWLIPEEARQASGGMAAFGDMVLIVLVAGVLSLPPTWFLLKLCVERCGRAVLAAELALAVAGPASWLAVVYGAGGHGPPGESAWVGLLIPFFAIPRLVAAPIVIAVEGATLFLARERGVRGLLAFAILADLLPLVAFAAHLGAAIRA